MSRFLDGKNIAITGAGAGIGKAIALAAAAEGANIVVADYGVAMDGSNPTSEVADNAVVEIKALGGQAVAVAGDISQFDVGEEVVAAACDNWGSIDGVVCPAGVLRERMLFNMSEDEWDHVVAVHLKGHFNVYRAALARMRKQDTGGSLVGFTSGAFTASTAQANYSAAKGGIVSLTRSAAMTAASLRLRGGPAINANCIAPVAKTRMSENVPFEIETGEPEDVAPMAVYLMSDAGRHINAQIYTVVGKRISVWNQPMEVRTMTADGDRWTCEQIAEALPGRIGQEPNPFIDDLERRMAEMAENAKSGSTS
ncbi:MAG: SDR family oxidoreductase [Acidimicrobiaceae bacterium]|nr:SDR family oxidoreductase [Acidimicrobiaceae bacterium]MXW76877.1 SDR family oxidoreductase [Acidimicrobiaceae bacterium]MYA74439.1 SDR family oxidoreductase [Acidimicrobiaceae bacterium]MYD05540.1 SDR family oxidoreductase [Acidimicrobiaceae bacterium]MYG55115.1 SDR family oxidoreductase [Acidimicrobiaceae bacterium]